MKHKKGKYLANIKHYTWISENSKWSKKRRGNNLNKLSEKFLYTRNKGTLLLAGVEHMCLGSNSKPNGKTWSNGKTLRARPDECRHLVLWGQVVVVHLAPHRLAPGKHPSHICFDMLKVTPEVVGEVGAGTKLAPAALGASQDCSHGDPAGRNLADSCRAAEYPGVKKAH